MTRILHISADYPDPLVPGKTRAVSNLLSLAASDEHKVYSINRVGWRSGIHALDFGDGCRAVAYGAPPKGLFLARFLDLLADWIAEDVAASGFTPDLVHAHKLSVEGLVGERLAGRFGVPLVVSVQGDSDLKIVGAKRDLRPRYRRIWRAAAVVFPFAPWAAERLEALLGPRDAPVRMLPCPGGSDTVLPPRIAGPVFRTAFHLASYRRKNAEALIRAAGLAAREVPDLRLEVIGGGDAAAFARLSDCADGAAPGRVRFLGALPHGEIPALLNVACGFPLVSRRESFGMVFAEALLGGCPVLIPRGWGIDGYLEDDFVVVADPADEAEIAAGLVRLARDEAQIKRRLAEFTERGGLDFLRRESIAQVYRDGVAGALAAAAPPS